MTTDPGTILRPPRAIRVVMVAYVGEDPRSDDQLQVEILKNTHISLALASLAPSVNVEIVQAIGQNPNG